MYTLEMQCEKGMTCFEAMIQTAKWTALYETAFLWEILQFPI